MIKKFFNFKTKTVTFAAGILAVSTFLNGFLGLLRDRLLASNFGAGKALDIYFAAFRIPDFIYGILIAGGIIAVFLPVFSEYYGQSKEKGWYFANIVLNCFLVLLVSLCLILLIFAPMVVKFIAPGFDKESKELTVSLTRIMLLSPIFFVLSSIFSGILHYFNHFLVYSIAPVLYNIGIILGIVAFAPLFGLRGLAYGVALGALLYLLIQIPSSVMSGFRYKAVFNFKHEGLKQVIKLLIPRIIGTAATHLNLIIITAIASTLIPGSIAIFNFSNNIQKFPAALIGLSFAAAGFPILARSWVNGQKKEFIGHFFSIFRQTLFLIVPVSIFFFILRIQGVRLVLGAGQFSRTDIELTAASVGIFAFSIFTFTLIPLLTRAFFSFQDTKTPVMIGIASIILNVVLCFLLVGFLESPNFFQYFLAKVFQLQEVKNIQLLGLPIALSLSGIFNFSLLFYLLYKKIRYFSPENSLLLKQEARETYLSTAKMLIASFFLIIFSCLVIRISANFLNLQTFLGLFFQIALSSGAGALVYIIAASLLNSSELKTIKSSVLEQFKKI